MAKMELTEPMEYKDQQELMAKMEFKVQQVLMVKMAKMVFKDNKVFKVQKDPQEDLKDQKDHKVFKV
jgi:hypothetical protein